MTLMRVPAKDLRPGDYTLGSKQTVLAVTNDGAHLPPGKVWLRLKRKSGTERTVMWSRGTMIGIDRPPLAASLRPTGATFEQPDGSTL